ncbi:MAG: ABC transporter ATP-binding protein [Planctomycetes bacterium]|nr:ABC transporter ATP-binding protein [Planctomycetota bacterium]
MQPVIEARNLSKTYRLYGNPYHRLLERLPWNRGRKLHREVPALQDVSFHVGRGECVGVVGSNGAGKSTLLKVLSGTTFPTAGSYTVNGRVTSLLELGAGFQPNFSGRENVFMNAALMGFSRKEAQRKYQEIVDFSELGEFIHAPVRTYSSGMQARLGFSVAVATEPDLLIIDEILAVGDMGFRKKCVERIWKYKSEGRSMFFCSHSLYDVRQICERAIWMHQGRAQLIADSVTVTNEYASYETKAGGAEGDPRPFADAPHAGRRPEDMPHIVEGVILDAATLQPRNTFAPGESCAIRVHVRNGAVREQLHLAIGARRNDGTECFTHATQFDGRTIDFAEGHVTLFLDCIRLLSGKFTVVLYLFDADGVHRYEERPANAQLIVQNRTKDLGLFLQDHRWRIEPLR